jgi:hypothetical protein
MHNFLFLSYFLPNLYNNTLSEQLLKLGCMRVGSKDINNVNHLVYISPLASGNPKQEVRRPNGEAGFKLFERGL